MLQKKTRDTAGNSFSDKRKAGSGTSWNPGFNAEKKD